MKVIFSVDAAAAIRGGFSKAGAVELELDPAKLLPEERELIAARYDGSSGKIRDVQGRDGRLFGGSATAPTIEGLLEAIRRGNAEAAKFDAARIAEEDKELSEQEARHAEILRERRTKGRTGWGSRVEPEATYHGLIYAKGRVGELKTWNSPEWTAWLAELDAQNAADFAALKAADESEKAAKLAAKDAGLAQLREWAQSNGSGLTKLRLDEGYDCWATSAAADWMAERGRDLAAAGFADAGEKEGYTVDSTEDRKCPTEAEILAIRKLRPLLRPNETAELVRVTYTPEKDEDGYDPEDSEPVKETEILVTVAMPHGFRDSLYLTIPTD
jgi:hypothetical protein